MGGITVEKTGRCLAKRRGLWYYTSGKAPETRCVVEDMTNAQSLLLPKTTTLIQELNTGNIDAICLEKPVADIYVAAYPDDLAVCSYEVPVEEGGVAIPVAKGQEDLQPKVMPSTEDIREYWVLVE